MIVLIVGDAQQLVVDGTVGPILAAAQREDPMVVKAELVLKVDPVILVQ